MSASAQSANTSAKASLVTASPRRRGPPLHRQLGYGFFIYGFLAPTVWVLERLGWAAWVLGRSMKHRQRALRALDPFAGYVPGPQDVFVATYPKSGTNWAMQVVHQLIHHGAAEFDHIHDVVPWPDTKVLPRVLRNHAISLEAADAWKRAPERKRVIKTHLNWEFLPESDLAHYLMVIRDPKDVFASSYYFVRDAILGPAMPSVRTWYDMFLRGRTLGGSWAVNAASCWAQRGRPNVLLLSFASMKRDLPGSVRRVADFLDITAPDSVIAAVCDQASFATMRRNDHKFHVGTLIPWRPAGSMVRKGAEGGAAELLTLEQQRAMDAHFLAELKALGSSLPYEEFARRA